MYCVESESLKTCFYSKNNAINYYRKQVYGQELFILDTVSGTYSPVKFTKLDIGIDDKEAILIKTEKGKWYLITRYKRGVPKGQYIFIIDALNGTWLYKEEITSDNNIYVDILYPVANRILPIIHVTRWNLYVKLFDVENESIYTMITINLEDMDKLVKLIVNNSERAVALKNNLPHYEIDYIESFSVVETKYLHDVSNKKIIYTKGIVCRFSLVVRYSLKQNHYYYETCRLHDLFCHIELDKEDVNCWLDLNEVKQSWADRHHYGTLKVNDTLRPVIHKYPISDEVSNVYLSTCLYKDQCYYVYNTSAGTGIIKVSESSYIELSPRQAALYHYGKYLIIFFYTQHNMLVIIDIENNRIGYWTFKHCEIYYRIHYKQYYSKAQNKLIFLSEDLEKLLIIDIEQLYLIFNSNNYSECIGNYNDKNNNKDKSSDILCCFDVNQLIAAAISRAKGIEIRRADVKSISHYIDTNSDTLYILATHFIDRVKYVGVFSFRMSCNNFTLKKLNYVPISILYNGLMHNIYKKLGMSKIFLYRADQDENVSRELSMSYDKSIRRLVDIRYNRNSVYVSTLRHSILNQSVFNYKDLIAVRYIVTISDSEGLSLLFIRSELALVKMLTAIQF